MESTHIICLEGGPCSGKSSVMAALQADAYPKPIVFVPEFATSISVELQEKGLDYPTLAANDRAEYLRYQQRIVGGYIGRITAARAEMEESGGIVVTDRGVAGVRAYVTETEWRDLTISCGTSPEDIIHDFADTVVFLGSLAVSNPAKYERMKQSNPIRTETVDEARELHFRTRALWTEHGNVIEVDGSDVEEKASVVRGYIGSLLSHAEVVIQA